MHAVSYGCVHTCIQYNPPMLYTEEVLSKLSSRKILSIFQDVTSRGKILSVFPEKLFQYKCLFCNYYNYQQLQKQLVLVTPKYRAGGIWVASDPAGVG